MAKFEGVVINGQEFPAAITAERDSDVDAVVFGYNGVGAVIVLGIPKLSALVATEKPIESVLHYSDLVIASVADTPVPTE
jgi:hypothetical protein